MPGTLQITEIPTGRSGHKRLMDSECQEAHTEKPTERWDFQIELVETAGRVVMSGMTSVLIPTNLLTEPVKLVSLAPGA